MQELNIASNYLGKNSDWDDDISGVIAIGDAIPTMRALVKFTFSGQVDGDKGPPVTMETSMVEADFSGKELGVSGAIMLAAFLPKCHDNDLCTAGGKALAEALRGNQVMTDLNLMNNSLGKASKYGDSDMSGVIAISDAIPTMGAMVIVNVMGNNIRKEQLSRLQEMMKAHPTLVSLCGIADDTTEADLSGLGMDADDAVVLADELPTKGAMTKLDMSNNFTYAVGGKAIAEALNGNQVMTELNVASNFMGTVNGPGTDMSGVMAISNAIPTMGALTSLDLSNNSLGAYNKGYGWISDISGVTALAAAILECRALTSLDMSENELCGLDRDGNGTYDASGVIALADALKNNGALTSLNLAATSLNTDSKRVVSEALRHCSLASFVCTEFSISKKIAALDLSNKGLAVIDVDLLAAVLAHNPTVTSLDLSHNQIGDHVLPDGSQNTAVLQLALTLKTNTVLTKINFSGTEIKNKGKQALGAALLGNRNSSLSYLVCDEWSIVEHHGQSVNLSNSGLQQGDAMLLAGLLPKYDRKVCRITALDLSKNEVTAKGFKYLAGALPQLSLQTVTFGEESSIKMEVGSVQGMEFGDLGGSDATIFLSLCGDASAKLPVPAPSQISMKAKTKRACQRLGEQLLGLAQQDSNEDGASNDFGEELDGLLNVATQNMHRNLVLNLGVLLCASVRTSIKRECRVQMGLLKDVLVLKKRSIIRVSATIRESKVKLQDAMEVLRQELDACQKKFKMPKRPTSVQKRQVRQGVHPLLVNTQDKQMKQASTLILELYTLSLELTFEVLEHLLEHLQGKQKPGPLSTVDLDVRNSRPSVLECSAAGGVGAAADEVHERARMAAEDRREAKLLITQRLADLEHVGNIEEIIDLCQGTLIVVQTKLVEVTQETIEKLFDDGYARLSNFGWLRKLWHVMVEFDPVELDRHADEVEQMIELIKSLYELEVKDSNLDEVASRWMVIYDLTGKLHCKAAYKILVRYLWAHPELRASLYANLIAPSLPPYPQEFVLHVKQRYAEIIRELQFTVSSIRRIQRLKQQALAYALSLFVALCIGFFNFVSRMLYDIFKADLGIPELADMCQQQAGGTGATDVEVQGDKGKHP
eukprot:g241.t1